jgi:uncharacterized protein
MRPLPARLATRFALVFAAAFLTFGGASASGATLPARIGPSFDCDGATMPLALMICASPKLSRLDLRFVQAFQALLYQVGKAGRSELWQEAINFQKSILQECGIPEAGPISGSPDCLAAAYERQRRLWLSRLEGAAREEAIRPIREHVALQAKLQQLGFLPATAKIDGVYGPSTRAAILAWQGANGEPETGFLGNAHASALEGAAPRVASKAEAPPPAPVNAPSTPSPPPAPKEAASLFDCSNITLPSTAVICGDPELRRLAAERQHAFNEAMARLDPAQRQELLADQIGWVITSATACGVPLDRPAPNPVPAAVKQCFDQVGRARIAYLRAYDVPLAATSAARLPSAVTTAAPPASTPTPSQTASNSAVASSIVSGSAAAEARQWWWFNYDTVRCYATPNVNVGWGFNSPRTFLKVVRGEDDWSVEKVSRDAMGTVAITVVARGSRVPVSFYWFPKSSLCDQWRRVFEKEIRLAPGQTGLWWTVANESQHCGSTIIAGLVLKLDGWVSPEAFLKMAREQNITIINRKTFRDQNGQITAVLLKEIDPSMPRGLQLSNKVWFSSQAICRWVVRRLLYTSPALLHGGELRRVLGEYVAPPAAAPPAAKPPSAPSVASAAVPEVKGAPMAQPASQSTTWPCSKSEFAALVQRAIGTGDRETVKGTDYRILSQGNMINGRAFDVVGTEPPNEYTRIKGVRRIMSPVGGKNGSFIDQWSWLAGLDGKVFMITHYHFEQHGSGFNAYFPSYNNTLSRNDPDGLSRWHQFLAHWCGAGLR